MKKLLSGIFGTSFPDFNAIIDAAFLEASQGFLFYGIIGLLLSVIILLLINTVPILKPQKRIFKLFNYINFIYLPILFLFIFGSFGAWNNSKKYTLNEVPKSVIPALKVLFPTFQLYVKMNSNRLEKNNASLKDAVLGFSNLIRFSPKSGEWVEEKKAEVAQIEIPLMLHRGMEAMVATEKENKTISNKKELEILKGMAMINVKANFWKTTEEKLIKSTVRHFNSKLFRLGIYSAVFSSLLIVQLLLKIVKKFN